MHTVSHHQHQAHVDAHVLWALPRQPTIGQPALSPAIEALSRGPELLIDRPHPVGALHVDPVLHRQHIGRVLPALHLPPDDDVPHLLVLEGVEGVLGLELAVPDGEFHLQALAQHPIQKRLHEFFLVHVRGCLLVAEW